MTVAKILVSRSGSEDYRLVLDVPVSKSHRVTTSTYKENTVVGNGKTFSTSQLDLPYLLI